MSLSVFFAENAEKVENMKYIASKRFKGEDGKPVEWILKPLSGEEDEELRKSCTRRAPMPGNKNLFQKELDSNLYMGKLAAACTVFPDLKNAELQNSYKVVSEDSLLKAMLTSGEYLSYIDKAQQLCGFSVDFDEAVEEAKNL